MPPRAIKLLKVAENGQISIGKEWAGRQIMVEKVSEGELRIVSGTFVVDRNATFYTQEAQEKLATYNQWVEKNPPRATDTDSFFDHLEVKAREKTKRRK